MDQSTSFLDTAVARIISLALALCFVTIIFVNWSDDIRLMAGGNDTAGVLPETLPVENSNPALAACLEKRVGDVNRMKADGIINDAQHAEFRARAEALCKGQNLGS